MYAEPRHQPRARRCAPALRLGSRGPAHPSSGQEEERLLQTTPLSSSAARAKKGSSAAAGRGDGAAGAKEKKGGRGPSRRLERSSCPCDASGALDAFELDAPPALKQGKSAEDTATGAPARRLLFEEVLASPRGSYPPVSDEVQRFLACTKMADEDKRAAAALLARRRRAGRMERHSV